MLQWQGRPAEPMATLGCDWHAVNDTILAHGRLLVDDPERIGPIQATGTGPDAVQPTRRYRTQQVGDHVRLPSKSEGPLTVGDVRTLRREPHAVMGIGEPTDLTTACSCAVPPSGGSPKG